jgi:hypothetical protein
MAPPAVAAATYPMSESVGPSTRKGTAAVSRIAAGMSNHMAARWKDILAMLGALS